MGFPSPSSRVRLPIAMNETFDPSLYNEDLAPIPPDQRQWGWINMATIWMGMVHNIVVYEAAAGLMALGFSAMECLEIVAVAYAILFVTMWFNARAGTRYGIPFCVLIRASFGTRGAQVPVLLRGFCAIFWFSVQAYAATQAIDAILGTVWPGWNAFSTPVLGMSLHRWGALALVWLLHGWVMNHGIERIGNFELVAGPLVIIVGACATGWALKVGHGLGPLFSTPSTLHGWAFVTAFAGGVTGMIGMWATFAVNIPDLSRFVRSQRDQAIGQAIGLPLTALIFTPMAIITTSATVLLFGHPIWNPVDLLLALGHPVVTVAGGAVIVLATLSVNVVANIMPACYDLINVLPRTLNFHRSSYLVLILGVAFMPWLWFSEAGSIFHILDIVSGLLGPVTGIMLADYFVLRREKLAVSELYRHDGRYEGKRGWGVPALISFVLGGLCAISGSVFPALSALNQISWFVGLGVSGVLYLALAWPQRTR
ncbi:putative allantoin permease [Swaminathania salitolerans]|uniref:Putative allantoin permease n=2 Tax=Swaminathania salitolerans TaxID=182838 RepID=A0A511BML1_9PROT|nr:putative allantoin permease [Swaminathania salitolerans]